MLNTSPLKMSSLFLYQAQLGGVATVSVTHNAACLNDTYAGNLALHVGDETNAVLASRATLETTLGMPIQWLNQVHGTAVYSASYSTSESNTRHTAHIAPTADAAITTGKDIALAIMTADCLPVIVTASNALGERAIGAAHAGWRGLLGGVLAETIHALNAQIPNATLHAHLGPCIGVGQFEVGSEVRNAFMTAEPDAGKYFTPKSSGEQSSEKYLCDLESLARDALVSLGVQSVSGGGWCSVSDPRLASYRRRAVTGRFATLVSLN